MQLQNLQGTRCQLNRTEPIFSTSIPNCAPSPLPWVPGETERRNHCTGLAQVSSLCTIQTFKKRENVWLGLADLAAGSWIKHLNDAWDEKESVLWGRKRYGLWMVTSWGLEWRRSCQGSPRHCDFWPQVGFYPKEFVPSSKGKVCYW